MTETIEQNGRVVQVKVDGVPRALGGSTPAEPTQRIAYHQQHSAGGGTSNGTGTGTGTPTHILGASAAAAAGGGAVPHAGGRSRSSRQQAQLQVGPVEVAEVDDVEMSNAHV